MDDRKLSGVLGPDMRSYFAILLAFSLLALPIQWILGAVELAATALLYLAYRRGRLERREQALRFIDSVAGTMDSASKSNLINSPLPTLVFRPDTGEVIWSNPEFRQLTGLREQLFEVKVEKAVPGLSSQWLLEGKRECPERVEINGRRFQVYGSMARPRGKGQDLLATTYWVDVTDADALRRTWGETRPVIALLALDNYEELVKACGEAKRSALLAQIDEKLSSWAGQGLFLRTQRDRWLCLFEEKAYQKLVEERFSILGAIRDVQVEGGVSPTLSIGVGKDAEGFQELYKSANVSLEMAFSRGGDQAVVRDKVDFEFFGGRTKTAGKRTKVKSRVMATALSELMSDAEEVYVMGHSWSDMDAVGAAVGICCAARKRGKVPHVVIDREHSSAGILIDRLKGLPEYEGAFLDPEDAYVLLRPGTLLVVVDTNRPDLVESPRVLEACNRVAVIDHHRRAASYIEDPAFSFHEPYASSASELVAELLQYMVDPSELKKEEAECLLAGIVLDTKHFSQRTGGRTFEAAAFLRRSGADPETVQEFFQSGLEEMTARYGIIRSAELYRTAFAVAAVEEGDVDRVTAAQAADELLTLKGVKASCVLYRSGDDVLLSARSLGAVNVQVILEGLGGGGNPTAAGGKIPGGDLAEVKTRLLAAIDAYFEE